MSSVLGQGLGCGGGLLYHPIPPPKPKKKTLLPNPCPKFPSLAQIHPSPPPPFPVIYLTWSSSAAPDTPLTGSALLASALWHVCDHAQTTDIGLD